MSITKLVAIVAFLALATAHFPASAGEKDRPGIRMAVDCTVLGHCSQVPGPTPYAYAPAIVHMNGEYHVFYCSTDGTHPNASGWDAVRYMHSSDGIHWSAPTVVLVGAHSSSDPSSNKDFSACDPSVVFYKGYYYLYYTSAYRYRPPTPQDSCKDPGLTNVLTDIQVARSATIDGTYLTYTDDNQWVHAPTNPKIIIKPGKELACSYGAGQPTVVVYNGKLMMWYNDTTLDPGGNRIYVLETSDPVAWPVLTPSNFRASEINVLGVEDVDVKYLPDIGQFIMYSFAWAAKTSIDIRVAYSRNGLVWNPRVPIEVPGFPVNYYANNIGVSGDQEGHVVPGEPMMIGFGAPYDLSASKLPDNSWGRWSLYTTFVNPPTGPVGAAPAAAQPAAPH